MNQSSSFPFGRLLCVVLLTCTAGAGIALAQEPPVRWGGAADSNMARTARDLPADPGTAQPLWEVKTGTHCYAIPTIDRGRVYLACEDGAIQRAGYKPTGGGALLCLDQATGKLIWQLASPRYFEGVRPPYHFDQWKCGICSSPLVDGDRVYVVSGRGEVLCLDRQGQANGNDGPVTDELAYMNLAAPPGGPAAPGTPPPALQPTDGDILWRYNLLTEAGVNPHDVCGSTLLMVGDLIYACTSNGQDDKHDKVPAPLAATLVVLDKKTGRLVARDNEKIGLRLFHCNWSSPLAGRVRDRTLVFFGAGDGVLYAFEPPKPSAAGAEVQPLKKVWSYDCNPPGYRTRDGQPVPYSSSSRKRPDGPSEMIGTGVFHEGRVYVAIGQSPIHGTGQGCLSCVDAATGMKVWDSTLVERTLATPAIADGLLYIPDTTGNLHCFDAQTGKRYWVHSLGGTTWPASAFVADGKVYASNEAGVLWVLRAGRELQVLSRTRTKSPATTPTAADGVLYLPTQRSLLALPGKQ